MAQVAASALATVVGALLASELGVYGTILGAAVVSVGATTGGAVFQHLFKRTGEQLRDAVDRTAGPGQLANGLRQAPEPAPADPPAPSVSPVSPVSSVPSEWNAPRVVRARRRWTWRSYAAVSALVFTLAMVPILAFELATGQPVSATVTGTSGSGTSLGGRVERKPAAPPAEAPSSGPSAVPSPSSGRGGAPSERPSPGTSPSDAPTARPSTGPGPEPSATPSSTPSATPSARPTGEPAPSATPSAPAGGGTTGDGAASAKPSGAATPKPPAPSAAAVPPPAPGGSGS
ncbi:hypothetical protein [Kitasatospora sp. NPDC093806]|uniref:hypothetical protein n=1 Tax=Kitasatospora sp. NPDC093806 TaxID=3155075 RepID=UPI00342F95E0